MPKAQPILIIDDNSDDVFLVERALGKCRCFCRVLVVGGGEEAIKYLKGEGRYADRGEFPLPGLILLDLHMPRVDGFQVLEWLRAQPELRHLPVIVLAGSTYLDDMQRAYEMGANSFLAKSADLGESIRNLDAVLEFWLGPGKNAGDLPLCVTPGSPSAPKGLPG